MWPVQLNGSLLSIGNAQLMESANRLMEQYSQRRPSVGSAHSDSKRNLLLLHNVGRTLQRTHNQLKKTRLLHAFYLFALPVYTLFGAFIFQALDGAQDDHLMQLYDMRCREERAARLERLRLQCRQTASFTPQLASKIGYVTTTKSTRAYNGDSLIYGGAETCFDEMSAFLTEVESCYRRWHAVNKTMTHPMSDFTNAVIYAFSVYTTIGYGTISANSMAARIATVIYGAFGIPLFFAFIKEEGNQCRMCFIWMYNWVKRWQRGRRRWRFMNSGDGAADDAETGKRWRCFCFCPRVKNSSKKKSSEISQGSAPQSDTSAAQPNIATGTLSTEKLTSSWEKDESTRSDCENCFEEESEILRKSRDINRRTSGYRPDYGGSEEYEAIEYRKTAKHFSHRESGPNDLSYSQNGKAVMEGGASISASNNRHRCALEQRRVFISGVTVFIVYLLAVSFLFSVMADWDFFTAFYFLFNSVALIGFGDVFPTQSSVILINMFFIVMGVVLFSMCYFILQEEIRVKAFEASRRARMSISKYSHSLMLHTKNPWSRRNSPAFDSSYGAGGGAVGARELGAASGGAAAMPAAFAGMFANNASAFDRLRKRRQSAPVITLSRNSRKSSRTEVLFS